MQKIRLWGPGAWGPMGGAHGGPRGMGPHGGPRGMGLWTRGQGTPGPRDPGPRDPRAYGPGAYGPGAQGGNFITIYIKMKIFHNKGLNR